MKKLFFALPLLLAGCQSERVAFHFQLVAPAASTAQASRPVADSYFTYNQPITVPAKSGVAATPTLAAASKPGRRHFFAAPEPTPRPAAATLAVAAEQPTLATPSQVAAPPFAPRLAERRLLRHLLRPQPAAGLARTTESGLGQIGLFFIVLVLGLLAGLGALVSLIPGVSFFAGVGLAAAGLLVLFILYSLVSGGKKKKPAAPSK